MHHLSKPDLHTKGDPTKNQIFLNTVTNMEKLAEKKGYKETGSAQLMPSDFRLLRAHLLSKRSIICLQMWVIIIVATKEALRHDEFHEIKLEHFLATLFEIPEAQERINALAFKVLGKADPTWVNLKIWADDVYPELCPVRPLLVYMYLIRIKGGYLFPTAAELANPPAD